jgi:hypothetical protein
MQSLSDSLEQQFNSLRMPRGAHLDEQPVRLAQLAMVRSFVAKEPRQLGALDVDFTAPATAPPSSALAPFRLTSG